MTEPELSFKITEIALVVVGVNGISISTVDFVGSTLVGDVITSLDVPLYAPYAILNLNSYNVPLSNPLTVADVEELSNEIPVTGVNPERFVDCSKTTLDAPTDPENDNVTCPLPAFARRSLIIPGVAVKTAVSVPLPALMDLLFEAPSASPVAEKV